MVESSDPPRAADPEGGFAAQPESEWLAAGLRCALEAWSYDRSSVREGARPRLVWHEYPLASIWVVAVTGMHESEHGTSLYCGEAPVSLSGRCATIAAVLDHAASDIERAARSTDRDRPSPGLAPLLPTAVTTEGWRAIADRLRARARLPDVQALRTDRL